MSDFSKLRARDLLRCEQEMQASERLGEDAFRRLSSSVADHRPTLDLVSILATHLFEAGQLIAQLDHVEETALSDYVEYNIGAGQLEWLWKELSAK